MRCPECKKHCPATTGPCHHCGADLAQPARPSSLGTLAALACVGTVLFKLFALAGPARTTPRPPAPDATSRAATPRATGPTLNGVPYDQSPLVQKLDLTRPAPPAPRR